MTIPRNTPNPNRPEPATTSKPPTDTVNPDDSPGYDQDHVRILPLGIASVLEPLKKLLALNPTCDASRILRVPLLQDLEGRVAETYDDARRLAELVPDMPESWCRLGRAAEATGRTDEATEAYRRYLELCGRVPELEEAYRAWDTADENDRPKDHPSAYLVVAEPESPQLAFPHTEEGLSSAQFAADMLKHSPLLLGMLTSPDPECFYVEVVLWQDHEFDLIIAF